MSAIAEPPPPCPECVQGKHDNCDGTTWDVIIDEPAACPCAEHGHGLRGEPGGVGG